MHPATVGIGRRIRAATFGKIKPERRTWLSDLFGLTPKRKDAEASLESTIASLRNSLEFIRQQDVKEREDSKIILHRPRIVETPLTTPLAAPTLRSVDTGDIAQAR